MGAFKRIYGGRNRKGVSPGKFANGAGGLVRHMLHELERIDVVKVLDEGGRGITQKGQGDLDRIASAVDK
jgi:small subunit ribosomal protein S19e